jgi:TRAP-type C4-dicarboxylate transport system permease small subunit
MMVLKAIDWILRRLIPVLGAVLLALMVVFTIYTIVMRTVFLNPPFWGDTLTLIANVWLVMLAFALSIRERQSIGLQLFAEALPPAYGHFLNILWSVLFALVGVIMIVWGYRSTALTIGSYWELGGLPKWVPMIILPVSGVLVMLASLRVLLQDMFALAPDEDLSRETPEEPVGPGTI